MKDLNYIAGQAAALENLFGQEKVAVYPEEYNASGALGALGGGIGGAAAGGFAGNLFARHLGQETRSRFLGLPIPGTGVGERMMGHDPGPLVGELIGGAAGGLAGAGMGLHGGHLKAIRKAGPPRRVVDQGVLSPELMQYLMQGQNGGQE